MSMLCPKCKKEYLDDLQFCIECGTKLQENAPSSAGDTIDESTQNTEGKVTNKTVGVIAIIVAVIAAGFFMVSGNVEKTYNAKRDEVKKIFYDVTVQYDEIADGDVKSLSSKTIITALDDYEKKFSNAGTAWDKLEIPEKSKEEAVKYKEGIAKEISILSKTKEVLQNSLDEGTSEKIMEINQEVRQLDKLMKPLQDEKLILRKPQKYIGSLRMFHLNKLKEKKRLDRVAFGTRYKRPAFLNGDKTKVLIDFQQDKSWYIDTKSINIDPNNGEIGATIISVLNNKEIGTTKIKFRYDDVSMYYYNAYRWISVSVSDPLYKRRVGLPAGEAAYYIAHNKKKYYGLADQGLYDDLDISMEL